MTDLVSSEYRKILEETHQKGRWFDFAGDRAKDILALTNEKHILDYGAGPGGFKKKADSLFPGVYQIHEYDPGVPEISATPEPAPYVVCVDVLEHIEPDKVDLVLDDLKRVTQKYLYVTIECQKAMILLTDGRNAHLTVQPPEWWIGKLKERFRIARIGTTPVRIKALLEAQNMPAND